LIADIFEGANPAEIPWELPNRVHFAMNLRTAKLLGLTIPADLLLRVDQVVE
jgi:putative tryptophan/tyrosine transport system substrate-binding protein